MGCLLHDPAATSWTIPIPSTLAILGTAVLYGAGWRRLRAASPGDTPSWRLASFLGGTIALWIAVCSPLATADRASLTFHMVQHLVTMTVAAPLLLLGRPAIVLPLASSGRRRPGMRAFLRAVTASRAGRAVTHPVSCWLAGTVVVVAWHVPRLHELGMSSPWHGLQHASFLAGGLLFWSPLVDGARGSVFRSSFHAVVYLFLATLPCDALSAFLAFCGRAVYHAHSAHAFLGLSPLQDQELAGGLMWGWVTFAYLFPAAFMTVRALSLPGASSLGGQVPAAR